MYWAIKSLSSCSYLLYTVISEKVVTTVQGKLAQWQSVPCAVARVGTLRLYCIYFVLGSLASARNLIDCLCAHVNSITLSFKNRASYIQDGRTATLQMLHYIYIFFSTNISTEYFKHTPFFSSKCRLFHNATFLVHVLFTFYIQSVLKFKCKTPVPKG